MKKTKNTTFIPPSSAVEKPARTTAAAKAEAKAAAAPHKRATVKRTVKSEKSKPVTIVTAMANDDDLQEVLDEGPIYDEAPMVEPEEIIPTPENLTPAEQRQRKRQMKLEKELSAIELIRKKSGLSEEDVAMIFELGYENELGRLIGYENLKKLKNDHLKRKGSAAQSPYRTAFGFRGEEYAGEQNQDSIAAAYLHDRKYLWLRMAGTLLLSLLLLFTDLPSLAISYLPPLFTELPILLPLIGLVLMLGVAALSHQQVYAGLESLFQFRPTPYSLPAIVLPFTLIYDVMGLWLDLSLRVNLLTALLFLLCVICDLFRFSCEKRTLELISTEGEKTMLVPATPRKKKLRHGEKIVKIINDDIGENRYQVRSGMQAIGFFRRFNDMSTAAKPFSIFLAIAFSLATLSAFAAALSTNQFPVAASAFMTVLFITLPACAVFAFFYPLSRANRLLAQRSCALMGEEAVEEFDQHKTVIFPDTDLYVAEKCTEIAVRESDDFKQDMRLAGILFRKLGGTLASIGETAPAAKSDPPVTVTRVLESGVEAVIDNRYHILAGDGEFLLRNGIRIPKESTDKILRRSSDVSLMYVAINGALKLSYEIEYDTKRPFERLIRHLADSNCAVAIASFDPNLDEVFVQKSRSANTEPISVIKPTSWKAYTPLEIADAEAVALKKPHDIVYPLHAAHAIGKAKRFAFRLQLLSSLLGAASAVLLTLLGSTGLLDVLPIAGYQLFWIAVFLIASISEINAEKLHFQKK